MNKKQICELLSSQLKLVRVEFNYTQEEMAELLGLSKKTLVQIEKGRQTANWTHIIALCALFQGSSILQNTLGGEPLELIKLVAHRDYDTRKYKTMGGKVWWTEKRRASGFIIQQNIILPIYRILDDRDQLWYYSFDLNYIEEQFEQLIKPP